MQVIVVLRHQAEVRPQGHLPDWYAVQAGEHGVKPVADVGKGHPPAVGGIGQKGEAEASSEPLATNTFSRSTPYRAASASLSSTASGSE